MLSEQFARASVVPIKGPVDQHVHDKIQKVQCLQCTTKANVCATALREPQRWCAEIAITEGPMQPITQRTAQPITKGTAQLKWFRDAGTGDAGTFPPLPWTASHCETARLQSTCGGGSPGLRCSNLADRLHDQCPKSCQLVAQVFVDLRPASSGSMSSK